MTVQPITVTQVTSTDKATIDELAQVMADSFAPGYLTRVIVDGDNELLAARMRMRVYEGIKDLEVYSASIDGKVGAVLIVAKPGIMWGETPNAKNKYGDISDAMLADRPDLREASKKLGEAFHELEVGAWGKDTTLPFYYITYLATAPNAQRKGLGAALVNPIAERARADGTAAVLLTQNEENVAWYGKLGFRDLAKAQVIIRDTAVNLWALATEVA